MNKGNNQNKYDIEKTFKEVNNDIQDGETWENDIFKISKINNGIRIWRKGNIKCNGFGILDDMKFKLERNKFNFTDAYKFYKQGKEIESLETGYRYKLINGADKRLELFDENWVLSAGFICIEIDGDWYINK